MKKIRKKKRFENPINSQVAKTLVQIEGVADVLSGGVEDIREMMSDLQHELYVVQEALEMNFWVNIKMQSEGHFDKGSPARDDAGMMIELAQEYQQEYLAVLAVSEFLSAMGQEWESKRD